MQLHLGSRGTALRVKEVAEKNAPSEEKNICILYRHQVMGVRFTASLKEVAAWCYLALVVYRYVNHS